MADAPRYRVIPPVALGAPFAIGWTATALVGDPFGIPRAARPVGIALLLLFLALNGPTYVQMLRRRTGILPGQPVTTLVTTGAFRYSRNPLYVGLVALEIGAALLIPSTWALLSVPVGVALLTWGSILPEETLLRERFGAEYDAYAARVRRWL